MRPDFDLIIVGGGLAGGLLAYRLRQRRPQWRVALLEREQGLGGNHTWSFHETDLAPRSHGWVRPFVTKSWDRHEVRFPQFERQLNGSYFSIRSQTFHQRVTELIGDAARLGACVTAVEPRKVTLADGTILSAEGVIDARGFEPMREDRVAYQKFIGWDVRLSRPHGLKAPLLMDATVNQKEGYRFFYVLPWDEMTCLIEDTRYCHSPSLDRDAFRADIAQYADSRRWRIEEWLNEEVGALPIPLARVFSRDGMTPAEKMRATGVAVIGVRANVFQATTGYSLPSAVRFVEAAVADLASPDADSLVRWVSRYSEACDRSNHFYRLLNRMLFYGAAPAERYRILQRFYRLPADLVGRFYSGEMGWSDIVRLLVGKPPIPLRQAWECLRERRELANV